MAMDERYCTNCRAALPPKAETCPACGVFAGEVFDGKLPRRKRSYVWLWWLMALVVLAGAAAIWHLNSRQVAQPPSVRVVGDRPGGARRAADAKINEAEAMRLVRRHLMTARKLESQCIALMSNGNRNGAYVITAVDSCSSTRLGKWRVDGRSGEVSQ